MNNIKNIVSKPAIAIAAIILALYCMLPVTATACGRADRETGLTVDSLDQIADGYDAGTSDLAFGIEIPLS